MPRSLACCALPLLDEDQSRACSGHKLSAMVASVGTDANRPALPRESRPARALGCEGLRRSGAYQCARRWVSVASGGASAGAGPGTRHVYSKAAISAACSPFCTLTLIALLLNPPDARVKNTLV